MVNDYLDSLPSQAEIREGLMFVQEHWSKRNDYIASVREMLQGANLIQAPATTQYTIKTVHMHFLTSVANEKAARFMHMPLIQVVPENTTEEARAKSTRIEKAIAASFYELERNGDGDVWSRLVFDAIVYDQGVERIERAPAAFWPEATNQDEGTFSRLFESKDSFDAYKKLKGLPIRTVYVEPEAFFPIYEGPTVVETYEVMFRSLRSVLRNPLFANSPDLVRIKSQMSSSTNSLLCTMVPVVLYNNHQMSAYYLLWPGETSNLNGGGYTKLPDPERISVSEPIALHSYPHSLSRVQYNIVAGRFGGWKSSQNRIEDVNRGILQLNQIADEVASQVLTKVRATHWPTPLFEVDPELRGQGTGGNPPKAPTIIEGQPITIFKGENVRPLFETTDDPQAVWVMDQLKEQISRLGGSSVLFGQRSPGVDTGYHANLQITQAEHLDEKIEEHLSQGAIGRATLFMQHVRALDTSIWAHSVEKTPSGKLGEYIELSPQDLTPLPRIDAAVRSPRPVDFAASVRTAREASDSRGGRGPLLSDDTIRADILGRSAPDEEERKIIVEDEKFKLRQSGLITKLIADRLQLNTAASQVPDNVEPGAVDPALLASIQQLGEGQGASNPGGANIQPGAMPLMTPRPGPSSPLPTGMPMGQAQPEANAGYAISSAGI